MNIRDAGDLTAQKIADLSSRSFTGKVCITVNLLNGGVTRMTASHEEEMVPRKADD